MASRSTSEKLPPISLKAKDRGSGPRYYADFRHDGKRTTLAIGLAWLEADDEGGWRPRRGRLQDGFYDERTATVQAAVIVAKYVSDAADVERLELERKNRGVTFREVARAYLKWLEEVKDAAPSTLRSHHSDLSEPGETYKRGNGTTSGFIMAGLGDLPATKITPDRVDDVLDAVAASGAGARSVNRRREIIVAVLNFGITSSRFKLRFPDGNPAAGSQRRTLPQAAALEFYTPEDVEALARGLANGLHRPAADRAARTDYEAAQDRQDAEAVRVSAYLGLRQGELLALRWQDVNWAAATVTVSRSVSATVERKTTKGRKVRVVPLSDPAAAALNRLSQRSEYTDPGELVICNGFGRRLDGSALRRRFNRARDNAGLRELRWHDLRHSFGSQLVASGIDLEDVRDAMGHTHLATTGRYLHARPATQRAAAYTRAFAPTDEPASEPQSVTIRDLIDGRSAS
jgi:integrase